MADSDEESERQRSRDKFRRERSDYDGRRRPIDKREPFDDRAGAMVGGHIRPEYQLGSRPSVLNRDRSPLAEPPYKRPRKAQPDDNRIKRDTKPQGSVEEDELYRPPLIPFKRFLEPLDELITEEDACNKYKEYKENYTKRHIEEFFEAHKAEEWLRFRYHPDHVLTRKEELNASLKRRLDVFMDLFDKGYLDNQSVQMDNSENLIRLMDAVVIKLEGGSDEDLKVLDACNRGRYFEEDQTKQLTVSISSSQTGPPSVSGHRSEEGEAETDLDADDSENDEVVPNHVQGADDKAEPNPDNKNGCDSISSLPQSGSQSPTNQFSGDEGGLKDDSCVSNSRVAKSADSETGDAYEDAPTPTTAEPPDGIAISSEANLGVPRATDHELPAAEEKLPVQPTPEKTIKKYPLHKTASIFFRALPPSITEAELNELCASQPGFLRLALWDPVPERRFMRHAWATYEPTVNIKKVCWALNTSPLLREKITMPNGELGATVNRDLAQRVRPLTPLTRHRPVMKHDLMLAAQLILRLDSEHGLWESEDGMVTTDNPSNVQENAKTFSGLSTNSRNPLLKNLTDYLVEEGGSEEEALLAERNHDGEDNSEGASSTRNTPVVLESDPALARALDYLILYLRIVHSVDFYAGAVYPMEDVMPHRCGILHARGDRGLNPVIPGSRPAGLVFSQREINDHLRNFEQKLRLLIDVPPPLGDEEMKKLGMRDPEKVAEEFIENNIQKRTGKKKPFKVVWVCPLSDKKFREPIFVRKHILNKHMDKIEAAKRDNAIFFNNYLRDSRRPSLPEAPYHLLQHYYGSSGNTGNSYRGSRAGRPPAPSGGGMGYRGPYRSHNTGPGGAYARGSGSFQDYYDVAAQQQQAMAAVAAAAAAALYPNAATDLYNLAATTGSRPGVRRGPLRPTSPGPRSYENRRRQNSTYSRRPFRSDDRGMVSYNDLDDPGNDGA